MTLKLLIITIFSFVAIQLIGCAYTIQGPSRGIKVAVMDLQIPQNTTTPARKIEGWWLGTRDIWRNTNLGGQAADYLTLQLGKIPNIAAMSRVQVKYYFLDKQLNLEDKLGAYPNPQQTLELLYRAPAQRFSSELGVDYILRGRINENHFARNRIIDWSWSKADISLELVNGDTGKVVWYGNKKIKKRFYSQTASAEVVIDQLLELLDREYLSRF